MAAQTHLYPSVHYLRVGSSNLIYPTARNNENEELYDGHQ